MLSDKSILNFAFQSGGTTLQLSESKVHEHQDIEFFKVELKDALQPGKIANVSIRGICTWSILILVCFFRLFY